MTAAFYLRAPTEEESREGFSIAAHSDRRLAFCRAQDGAARAFLHMMAVFEDARPGSGEAIASGHRLPVTPVVVAETLYVLEAPITSPPPRPPRCFSSSSGFQR